MIEPTWHSDAASALGERIARGSARIGIIGLGYIGLPLAQVAASGGYAVTGFDIDPAKVESLNAGRSYIRHIPSETIAELLATGRFEASGAFDRLGEMDVVILCVPTPLGRHREPDLSYVEATARSVAQTLRPGQLVVLESTTYPGTTTGILKPILEAGGLRSGTDFFLAYAPEREDPGNPDHTTRRIPKVVGGDGPDALALASLLYGRLVLRTVPVSSPETAEAVKLTENIFRAVNIALVNELKTVFEAMGIDVWEVVEAARTKPFGYMPFYPGPGLGGHCIPIDPFYLTWKAQEHGVTTRFIELAGEINTAMPGRVIARLAQAVDRVLGRGLSRTRVLVTGLAYKRNVDDMRESPSLRLIELLEAAGATVDYFDPYIPEIGPSRDYGALKGRRSIEWSDDSLRRYDAALIATDHDDVDYAALVAALPVVVDTRNACAARGIAAPNVFKA